jgi:hypothetical protein
VGLEWWGEKSSVVFNSNCKLMRNAFVVVGKKKFELCVVKGQEGTDDKL